MANIAHDQDFETFEQGRARLPSSRPQTLGQNLANRESVEETLGGVLVLPIAAVNDSHVWNVTTHLEGGAAGLMTHHYCVDAQSVNRCDRVA